jgi:F-type H+-transporting ATPase subunit b
MIIDWFTIGAQILNFLVLVYLLRRFLYPPLIRAMDKRERRIAARHDEAEQMLKQAKEAEASYVRQQQELTDEREALMTQAREEADKLRQELADRARAEVDADQARWHKALKHQKDELLNTLRVHLAEQVMATARRALRDLADEELEDRIISNFLLRVSGLKDAETAAVRTEMTKDGGHLRIASAFDLSADTRNRVKEVVKTAFGDGIKPVFTKSGDLIGGVEMIAGEIRIAWSLQDYLADVEQEFSKIVATTK